MPLPAPFTDIPDDEVDMVISMLVTEGWRPEKRRQPDGRWTVFAHPPPAVPVTPGPPPDPSGPVASGPLASGPAAGGAPPPLGTLSERYESNGDPGAIGVDRVGGPSYGSYQIATRPGTMATFLTFLDGREPAMAARLEQAGGAQAAAAGTNAFRAAWRALAADPAFAEAQRFFIETTHYDVMAEALKRDLALDLAERSNALGQVVWSVAVQHGAHSPLIHNALDELARPSVLGDAQIIRAVYAERSLVDIYFRSSTAAVKEAVRSRFRDEMERALAMLEAERPAGPVSPSPAVPVTPDGRPDDPLWLKIAFAEKERVVREVPGAEHNPRILAYHATTGLGATDDETPWCSSFVNYCIEESGLQGTDSAAARSWEQWGREIASPVRGAIAVFSRGSNPAHGHVGFFVGMTGGRISVLGGNQGDAVSIRPYDAARLICYRLP